MYVRLVAIGGRGGGGYLGEGKGEHAAQAGQRSRRQRKEKGPAGASLGPEWQVWHTTACKAPPKLREKKKNNTC